MKKTCNVLYFAWEEKRGEIRGDNSIFCPSGLNLVNLFEFLK